MKLFLLLSASLLAPAPAPGTQPAPAPPQVRPYSFVRSVQFELPSKISGRTYQIFVHTPPTPPPPGGYPVIFVTDGNTTFPITAGQAELEALVGGHMLVVGVGYTTSDAAQVLQLRNRDLTPSPWLGPASEMSPMPGVTVTKADFGGGELFYKFLTEELRPALASVYKMDPNDQTLYGHSLGGLFALGVLFHHPNAFNGYVASSPSIWYNDREVLAGEADFRKAVEAGGATPRILIEVGGEEQTAPSAPEPGMSPAQFTAEQASLERARMVGNAVDLAARLKKVKGGPGYQVSSQVFEHEDHISTMAASMSRALVFAEKR